MFQKPSAESIALEETILTLEVAMRTKGEDTDDYATMLNRLERLYKLKEKNAPKRISPDTMLIVGGNLFGILVIVYFEQAHVLTSKALSFAGKLR